MKEDLSAMPHENDGSGQVSVLNGAFDHLVDSPECDGVYGAWRGRLAWLEGHRRRQAPVLAGRNRSNDGEKEYERLDSVKFQGS